MFAIKADTPEEMRDQIVKWLKHNASNHRIAAANARLAGTRSHETSMAMAYQGAAEFLEKMAVERKS